MNIEDLNLENNNGQNAMENNINAVPNPNLNNNGIQEDNGMSNIPVPPNIPLENSMNKNLDTLGMENLTTNPNAFTPNNLNVGTPNVENQNTASNVNNVANGISSNFESINLQPEGMFIEEPKVEKEVVQNPSPLMGSTLTENTNLFNNTPIKEEPIPSLNTSNNQEVLNTISPVGITPSPAAPNELNGVPVPPQINEIPNNNGKKKNKKNKENNQKISMPILIMLIIAILALIGYGVYFFLNKAEDKNKSITPILTNWEKGEILSDDISIYANVSGVDKSSCTINKDGIDINTVGRYSYTVSCPGMKEQTGEVEVLDSAGPKVSVEEVVVIPNSIVTAKDFIASCKDATIKSGCSIKFSDETEEKIQTYLENEGEYEVNIIISDDYDNTTEVVGKLKVSTTAPTKKLTCEKSSIPESTVNANITEKYEYRLNDNDELYDVKKIRIYDFANMDDFNTTKEKYETIGNIDDVVGNVKLEEEYKLITITSVLNDNLLKKEFEIEDFPTTRTEIENYHTEQEDMCSIE